MKLCSKFFLLDITILFLAFLVVFSVILSLLKPGIFLSLLSEENAFIVVNDTSVSLLEPERSIKIQKGTKIFKIDISDRIILNNYSDDNIYKVIIDFNL